MIQTKEISLQNSEFRESIMQIFHSEVNSSFLSVPVKATTPFY